MNDKIRSLYIRVLRGKNDRGRGKPNYMRNVVKEIEWYYKYDEIKKAFNRDEHCPEDILFGWTSSRMPGCYKWARQFLPEDQKSEDVLREIEEDRKREEERKKREELKKQGFRLSEIWRMIKG